MSGKKLGKTKIDKESREKTPKRTLDGDFEDDMARLISQYQASAKKKKMETSSGSNPEYKKTVLELVNSQIEARQQRNSNLFKRLEDVTNKVEADYNIMKENKIKFDNLIGAFMKCIQQASDAFKQNVDQLKDITTIGQKDFEEMESRQTAETEKAMDELEYDIKKLQEKVVIETKRSGWETLSRSVFHAMQNDL